MSIERQITQRDLEQLIFAATADGDEDTAEKLGAILTTWVGSGGLIIKMFANETRITRYESQQKKGIGFHNLEGFHDTREE